MSCPLELEQELDADLKATANRLKWTVRAVFGFFSTIIVAVMAMVAYWLLEPDPLTVVAVNSGCSTCEQRKFNFDRLVVSTKALDVYVQQRWYNVDGMDDSNGVEFEHVITTPDYYPLGADFKKLMGFNKCVPDNIPVGRYEYRPWATYQVNPLVTVTRLLPTQYVEVVCDFDESKHESCKQMRKVK